MSRISLSLDNDINTLIKQSDTDKTELTEIVTLQFYFDIQNVLYHASDIHKYLNREMALMQCSCLEHHR